jgi:phytoene dehydrogenase-like protein
MHRQKRTAVVIGAGVAGLSAALEFAKSGVFAKVLLLEGACDVGGNVRSRLVKVGDCLGQTRWVDFGALQFQQLVQFLFRKVQMSF